LTVNTFPTQTSFLLHDCDDFPTSFCQFLGPFSFHDIHNFLKLFDL
jgi:hypothetical protein